MAWRAARSLTVLHAQLKSASRAAPPATGQAEWGLIGDTAHDNTSDHAPHDFSGWGSNIVTAADFPNRPDLGLDAHAVLDAIRQSRDARAKYGISNGEIFSGHTVTEHGRSYPAWVWRPYLTSQGTRPSDGHYTHGHLSVVGDSRADSEAPWHITDAAPYVEAAGDEDDMGASFGPIAIEREGVTSLTIPPTQGGIADPRRAWLNFCNDTGQAYGLRVWCTSGNESYSPFPGTSGGLLKLHSGQRWSVEIPAGTSGLSIMRQAVDASGAVVSPSPAQAVYGGHLTCCIERGSK